MWVNVNTPLIISSCTLLDHLYSWGAGTPLERPLNIAIECGRNFPGNGASLSHHCVSAPDAIGLHQIQNHCGLLLSQWPQSDHPKRPVSLTLETGRRHVSFKGLEGDKCQSPNQLLPSSEYAKLFVGPLNNLNECPPLPTAIQKLPLSEATLWYLHKAFPLPGRHFHLTFCQPPASLWLPIHPPGSMLLGCFPPWVPHMESALLSPGENVCFSPYVPTRLHAVQGKLREL